MKTLIQLLSVFSLLAAGMIASCGDTASEAWFGFPRTTDLDLGVASPSSVRFDFGDFNGDKRPDLLVQGSGTLFVAINNGDGTFRRLTSVVTQESPSFAASGDLNADGVLDLVVITCPGSDCANSASLSTHLGKGDGTFEPAVVSALSSDVVGMGVGDLNGDGCADMVIGRSDTSVFAFLGNCAGTFGEPIAWREPTSVLGLITAAGFQIIDMNADVRADIVEARDHYLGWGVGGIAVLLGAGDGSLGEVVRALGGFDTTSFVSADFNRDGIPDLVSQGSRFRGFFPSTIWLGLGDGSFDAGRLIPCPAISGTACNYYTVGDVDGDLLADFVVPTIVTEVSTGPGRPLWVALNKGDGAFADPLNTGLVLGADEWLMGRTVDVNGDGKADLVSSTLTGVSVRLNVR